MLRTYADLLDHVARIATGHGLAPSRDQLRTAINAAYAALPLQAPWQRYQTHIRLSYQAPRSYVVNVASDGKTVTISSGSWPNWVDGCTVHIAGYTCQVGTTLTSRRLVLSIGLPQAYSDTRATFYNDVQPLPDNYVLALTAQLTSPPRSLVPIQLPDPDRFQFGSMLAGQPCYYLIEKQPSPRLRLYPPPATQCQVDFWYRRSLKPLLYTGHDARDTSGLILPDGTTVEGQGTQFHPSMEGCVLRTSMNDAAVPTGPEGLSPFREERLIDTVVSATQLRVQTPFLETYMSPVRYAITDVLDVDEHLYQLLTALTMEQLGQMVGKPFAVNVVEAYRAALAADSAQSVSFQQRLGLAPRTIHARIETDYV